jgi:RNA polymerase sigma-70 factor (ECF subfamily)
MDDRFTWQKEANGMDLQGLIAQHHGSIFAFLFRMTGDAALSEELQQEVFLRAVRAGDRYRATGKITTWLFAIAANLVRDEFRRAQRAPLPLDLETTGPPSPSAEEVLLAGEEVARLRQALLSLPPEHRSALILRFYHDLSYAEIAVALGIPLGTVRSRLHNGVERLKILMQEEVALR